MALPKRKMRVRKSTVCAGSWNMRSGRTLRRSALSMKFEPLPTVRECAMTRAQYSWGQTAESAHPRAVIFQDAAVHHHKNSRFPCLFRGLLVNYIFLHPNGWHFELDRLIDNFPHKFRTAKNIDDVDLPRNIEQARVRFLTQALFDVRIYRNDPIAVALHVGGDAMTGAQGIAREANNCNGFGAAEQVSNGIGLRK